MKPTLAPVKTDEFTSVDRRAHRLPSKVPLRSWIKLGIVAYQANVSAAQAEWAAKHIDWFDSPYPEFLPLYKSRTDAPMVLYDNYYCLYVGDDKCLHCAILVHTAVVTRILSLSLTGILTWF